jgi:hypothetical protein
VTYGNRELFIIKTQIKAFKTQIPLFAYHLAVWVRKLFREIKVKWKNPKGLYGTKNVVKTTQKLSMARFVLIIG